MCVICGGECIYPLTDDDDVPNSSSGIAAQGGNDEGDEGVDPVQ